MARRSSAPRKAPAVQPRPTDAELAERLRGTRGLCLVRQFDLWLDIVSGSVGTRDELEAAWLAAQSR